MRYSLSLWRLPEASGWGHYVVGRAGGGTERPPVEVVIPWDRYEVRVSSFEVFSAVEAAEVFGEYYETGWVSGAFNLRPLDL
ncbi:hypothetical protein [Kribbella sp. NPDC004536]|uniref:hypothetical protein n=1 Tax=Kribbella sp. NPDC004536 TaxID=3364106 RepID=UPI003699B4CC